MSIISNYRTNQFHILACVNDDSTENINGYTCSDYSNVKACGKYDTDNFTASVQCCACGGGNVTGVVE